MSSYFSVDIFPIKITTAFVLPSLPSAIRPAEEGAYADSLSHVATVMKNVFCVVSKRFKK